MKKELECLGDRKGHEGHLAITWARNNIFSKTF